MSYAPPLTLTSRLIDLISRVSEALGRWEVTGGAMSPHLRRESRIRTIQALLKSAQKVIGSLDTRREHSYCAAQP